MKRIVLTLITALIWTTASANNAHILSLVFASEMNATAGCTAREEAQALGGDCWTLNGNAQLHKTYADLVFTTFYDLHPIGPWHLAEGGIFRLFTLDDDSMMYSVMLFDLGRESVGVVAPAE